MTVDYEIDVKILVVPKVMKVYVKPLVIWFITIYNKYEAWHKFLGTKKEKTNQGKEQNC